MVLFSVQVSVLLLVLLLDFNHKTAHIFVYIFCAFVWVVGFLFGYYCQQEIPLNTPSLGVEKMVKPSFSDIYFTNTKIVIYNIFGVLTLSISGILSCLANGYVFGNSLYIIKDNTNLIEYFFTYAIIENVCFIISAKVGIVLTISLLGNIFFGYNLAINKKLMLVEVIVLIGILLSALLEVVPFI